MDVELVPFPICEGMILIPYGYRDYTVGKVAHQMQDFQLDKHKKTFGGRAPAQAPPDPLAAQRGPTSYSS